MEEVFDLTDEDIYGAFELEDEEEVDLDYSVSLKILLVSI